MCYLCETYAGTCPYCLWDVDEEADYEADDEWENSGTYPDHPCSCGAVQEINGRLVQVADCCC